MLALGAHIRFEEPVKQIHQTKDHVDVVSKQGKRYRAYRLIIACPPNTVAEIDIQPPLPAKKRELIDNFPMGNFVKFIATFKTPFWREKDIFPLPEIDQSKYDSAFVFVINNVNSNDLDIHWQFWNAMMRAPRSEARQSQASCIRTSPNSRKKIANAQCWNTLLCTLAPRHTKKAFHIL